MIPLSPEAECQLKALAHYHAERGRAEAIDNLLLAVERACDRYAKGRGAFYAAPWPYPNILQPGWRWTKEARYWLAFVAGEDRAIIAAVVFEGAHLPSRL